MTTEALALSSRSRHRARVVTVEKAGDARIFDCTGGDLLSPVTAGSHIDVYVGDGTARQYSLLPSRPGRLRFAVKLEKDGRGGSRYLCETVTAGQLLEIGMLRNNFKLEEAAYHTVLIAGGIGITPFYSMIARLAELGASWELHYCSRSGRRALFAEDLLSSFPSQVSLYDGAAGVRLNLRRTLESAPESSHFYCCGPAPLINEFSEVSAGRPPEMVHVERFEAAASPRPAARYQVRLRRSGKILDVAPGKSLLQTLLDAGIDVPFSCGDGVCGACEIEVVGGTPDHRDSVLSASERQGNKSIIACCSASLSEVLDLDL